MEIDTFEKLLAATVDKLATAKSKKGLWENVAVFTALVAALGSFAGAVVSVNSSLKSNENQAQITETQKRIDLKQDEIDARQKKLDSKQDEIDRNNKLLKKREWRGDENTRISRLSYSVQQYCPSIPLDDEVAWTTYKICIEKGGEENKSVEYDQERYKCANYHSLCYPK
jgi:hypothetical protein